MLRINNLYKAFDKRQPVLSGVSLSLLPGQAICIAGKNATGKTTLLRLACGILTPDVGTVLTEGRVAYVPQEPALLPELSVKDNLMLWYAAQNLPGPTFSPQSPEALLGLASYRNKSAGTLSGGMKKRLSIAQALVSRPDYLLLDEPFSALDAVSSQLLVSVLCAFKRDGVGILFSAHEPEQICAVADVVKLLQQGRLSQSLLLESVPEAQRPTRVLSLLFSEALTVLQPN